jgi:hypothetical protein
VVACIRRVLDEDPACGRVERGDIVFSDFGTDRRVLHARRAAASSLTVTLGIENAPAR